MPEPLFRIGDKVTFKHEGHTFSGIVEDVMFDRRLGDNFVYVYGDWRVASTVTKVEK